MKNTKFILKKLFFISLMTMLIISCNDDDDFTLNDNPPPIIEETKSIELSEAFSTNRLNILAVEPETKGYDDALFTWSIGDSIIGTEKKLEFISLKDGVYTIQLKVENAVEIKNLSTQITVNQEENPYSKYIAQVFDFQPAVGQFTNVLPKYEAGDTKETMIQKASSIVGEKGTMISLGGYGGYVVFGFDHTIINIPGKRDFKVLGNAFWGNDAVEGRSGSCEPGIIMVAYDKNKNGIPDEDEWYEIAGSEYSKDETLKNYTITYYKPEPDKIPVPGGSYEIDAEYIRWEDNYGNSGYKVQNSFHRQNYFPQWITEDKISFTGTRLPDNYYDQSGTGSYWVGKSYEYGYADNAPNNDEASNIDIEWAVDKNGNSVKLPGIDFVKVYTGINQEAGWLGEVSTEISGAYDLHID